MSKESLLAHLATGTTTVCRAWTITRRDGTVLGFTDHDADLMVDGIAHKAATGLTARELQTGNGLAVDNTEVLGALTSGAISEADLVAGRYDGAEVCQRLVNWADTSASLEVFRGTIGEVVWTGAEFKAELRGLSDKLNQPVGLAYTRTCSAVLGDSRCGFDLSSPGYFAEVAVTEHLAERAAIRIAGFQGYDERWFEGGRVEVLSGQATGLTGTIKADRQTGADREIQLWQSLRAPVLPGDLIRLTAGCDKRLETCRAKFANLLNFRGFPFIPGEDWLSAYPRPGQANTGGSLTSG